MILERNVKKNEKNNEIGDIYYGDFCPADTDTAFKPGKILA